MKKTVQMVLVCALIICIALPLSACGKKKLTDMTHEEQLEFLEASGVEIPSGYENFAAICIEEYEQDPDHVMAVSNPIAYDLALDIQNAVNEYYEKD